MRRRKWVLSVAIALACFGSVASAQTVVDLDVPDSVPSTVADGDVVYVTNTGGAPVTGSTAGGLTIDAGGKLYVGYDGSGGTIVVAGDKITLDVNGDMNVNGALYLGIAMGLGPFTEAMDVNIHGDMVADESGLMIIGSGGGAAAPLNVTVDGSIVIRTGGHHFIAYHSSPVTFDAMTFVVDGGEVEVIGSSGSTSNPGQDMMVVKTNATSGNAVHVTNGGELTIMRGTKFDQSAGGDFTVDAGSELVGGSGGGKIVLASGGSLNISEDSTVNLWRGKIKVEGAGSTVNMNGTLILGYNPSTSPAAGPAYGQDGPLFTSLTGVDVNIGSTAKIALTNDFIKEAMTNYTVGSAGITVIEGTSSLAYAPDSSWTGEKSLFSTMYGDVIFSFDGTNAIKFERMEANDFSTEEAARATAANHLSNVFAQANVDSRMISAGVSDIMLGVSSSVSTLGLTVPGVTPIAGDGSKAAQAFRDIFTAMARGVGSEFGEASTAYEASAIISGSIDHNFLSGFASMYKNNRGSHANSIAMNSAGQMQSSVGNRILNNNASFARVRDAVGSDAALASSILNSDYMNRVWAGGLGMWEDADARKGMPGYKYDSYGFIMGYDKMFGPVTVGAAFGYTNGNYEDKAAVSHDSDIENYSVSLYAAYTHCSGLFASVVGGYTYSDNYINEFDSYNWATEDFHTDTWNVGMKFGYDWRPTSQFTLTPSAGLNYVHARNSGHEVKYAGIGLMRYDRASNHSTTLPIELAANYDIPAGCDGRVNLNGVVGYSYNFNRDGMDSNVTFNGLGQGALRATGREQGRHAFNAGAGVKYVRGNFDIGVRYDYYSKADYDAHRVTGTVGLSF